MFYMTTYMKDLCLVTNTIDGPLKVDFWVAKSFKVGYFQEFHQNNYLHQVSGLDY